MKRNSWIAFVVALVVAVVPLALAGGGDCSSGKDAKATAAQAKTANDGHGHGCSEGTQVCLNKMAVKLKQRGWVGVELDDGEGELRVVNVKPQSPAAAAGIREGDVLVALNGIRFDDEKNHPALKKAKKSMSVGQTVTYTVARRGGEKRVDIKLAEIPEAVIAEWIGRHMMEHAEPIEIAQY